MNLSKFLLPPVACLASALLSAAAASVGSLRTEYLETPLGIDEPRPLFSWQMSSDRIGAAQTAYRVLVAEGEDALEEGVYVYDSGTVASRQSLNVPYRGRALEGMTRYFWKVLVTDDTGTVLESEPSWFETGLMNEGWSRAEWIGSEAVGVSRYRTFFNILYDVRIPEGSRSAVFAYSVKDEDNFITAGIELGRNGGASFSVDYCVDGDMRHLATVDISDIVTSENAHETHSVELKVSTPGYHLKSNLIVLVDGKMLRPSEGVPGGPAVENVSSGNPCQMVITPYPDGEYITDWARLHSIGFRQPRGQKAVFSNIRITEDNWNTLLYADPQLTHEVTGTGRLDVWEPYGKVSAPMLRRNVDITKPVKSARLYVTARGIYEFYINGSRVGNDWFNPGWTDYRYRIMYNTYDITGMLRPGSNGFGAMLGSGWYSDLNIFTSAYVDPYGIRQEI